MTPSKQLYQKIPCVFADIFIVAVKETDRFYPFFYFITTGLPPGAHTLNAQRGNTHEHNRASDLVFIVYVSHAVERNDYAHCCITIANRESQFIEPHILV